VSGQHRRPRRYREDDNGLAERVKNEPSDAARQFVVSLYEPSVAEYLLAGDGFKVAEAPRAVGATGPDLGLVALWRFILDELVENGHMRRSETGRYWWAGP
jgi:hypothetical protein